jgi:2-alkyl-3-oxoalkanoate reductase
MKIFLAGGTGAIGKRLIPMLIKAGHQVVASTRSRDKSEGLQAAGAQPVVVDGLDRAAVKEAVTAVRPELIVHQMTALANVRRLRKFDDEFAVTNELRTRGTEYLLEAAQAAGARSLIAQSFTGWPNHREGSRIKSEDDPLDPNPPETMSKSLDAIRRLEAMVAGAAGIVGIVLRYGMLYGPGTALAPGGEMLKMVRHRKLPIVGEGSGVWSFLHVDDAVLATVLAIERGTAGIYNIVDSEPVEVSVWLPELALTLDAKPPYHVPTWLGRLAIGEAGVSMMTKIRGSSNAKAQRILGWRPKFASYRDGFRSLTNHQAAQPARANQ